MNLALLLDEQISPAVARQVRARNPPVPIESVYEWKEGGFTGVADRLLLRAAAQERLTRTDDIGGLVRAVLTLWEAERRANWIDRVAFLQASKSNR